MPVSDLYTQSSHSLGYGYGPGRDIHQEMGWSTKPRYQSALVGNWQEEHVAVKKIQPTDFLATLRKDYQPTAGSPDHSVTSRNHLQSIGLGPEIFTETSSKVPRLQLSSKVGGGYSARSERAEATGDWAGHDFNSLHLTYTSRNIPIDFSQSKRYGRTQYFSRHLRPEAYLRN